MKFPTKNISENPKVTENCKNKVLVSKYTVHSANLNKIRIYIYIYISCTVITVVNAPRIFFGVISAIYIGAWFTRFQLLISWHFVMFELIKEKILYKNSYHITMETSSNTHWKSSTVEPQSILQKKTNILVTFLTVINYICTTKNIFSPTYGFNHIEYQ